MRIELRSVVKLVIGLALIFAAGFVYGKYVVSPQIQEPVNEPGDAVYLQGVTL